MSESGQRFDVLSSFSGRHEKVAPATMLGGTGRAALTPAHENTRLVRQKANEALGRRLNERNK
jgi:hypothetical protein